MTTVGPSERNRWGGRQCQSRVFLRSYTTEQGKQGGERRQPETTSEQESQNEKGSWGSHAPMLSLLSRWGTSRVHVSSRVVGAWGERAQRRGTHSWERW